MLLRLTYVDIPIGFELDLHLEECKSTLKMVQIQGKFCPHCVEYWTPDPKIIGQLRLMTLPG